MTCCLCVPPHACRSLRMQPRVHELPAVRAEPAGQGSAHGWPHFRPQPPAPGLLHLPPHSCKRGEAPPRPPQGPPFAVSTLFTHTCSSRSPQPRSSPAGECIAHGGRVQNLHSHLHHPPSAGLLTWDPTVRAFYGGFITSVWLTKSWSPAPLPFLEVAGGAESSGPQ